MLKDLSQGSNSYSTRRITITYKGIIYLNLISILIIFGIIIIKLYHSRTYGSISLIFLNFKMYHTFNTHDFENFMSSVTDIKHNYQHLLMLVITMMFSHFIIMDILNVYNCYMYSYNIII